VSTDPPLEPVVGDEVEHRTACLHPLRNGEDLSQAVPEVADSALALQQQEVDQA